MTMTSVLFLASHNVPGITLIIMCFCRILRFAAAVLLSFNNEPNANAGHVYGH